MPQRVHDQLSRLAKQIQEAAAELARDRSASPTLGAVFGDFRDKALRAEFVARDSDNESVHDLVVEMRHAGEITTKAALADLRLSDNTRNLLLQACDGVHSLAVPSQGALDQTAMQRSPRQENL